MTEKYENTKELIFATALYTTGSIAGPLIIFGGAGWALDVYAQTRPWGIIGGVAVAFIITNVLLFKKAMRLTVILQTYGREMQKKQAGAKNTWHDEPEEE